MIAHLLVRYSVLQNAQTKTVSEQMKDVRWHLRGAIKSTSNIVDVILQAGQTSGRIVQCVPYLEHHVRPLSQQHDI